MKPGPWIKAARLRTLPLAFSSIILGTCLAAGQGYFDGITLLLTLLTTLCYQVLSNYANDYGDGIRGTDAQRTGEQRAVASGAISQKDMRRAVQFMALLSFLLGTYLSFWATRGQPWWVGSLFTLLGLTAIWAAIRYTVGGRAYGYHGWGDFFVLAFFGWLGVGGAYFLQSLVWDPMITFPASSLGLLAAGVLNVNNMRDRENDHKHKKYTLAVRLGARGAKLYHGALLLLAFDLAFIYNRLQPASGWQNLYFLAILPLGFHLWRVSKAQRPEDYEPLLKQLAISTLLFSVLFGVGRIL